MRCFSIAPALALAIGLTVGGTDVVFSQQPADKAAVYPPDEQQWRDGPPSLPPGAKIVVLEGDPSVKGGYFALRLALPDGYRIPPHWHPVPERVTVISGTFHLGMGEEFDEQATRALPAGTFFTMPAEMRHFARAEGETVLQLNSIGPFEIHYVNPADDPRGTN
jgi:quercetin dioxygenase-like cupin family protein